MANVDSQFAPQAQQSQGIPLASMINLAINQQRSQRSFENQKKEYAASQLIGRLKSYEDNPAKHQAYFQVLQKHPQASQLFADVGLDLNQFATVVPESKTVVALGEKGAQEELDIFSSAPASKKRAMERQEAIALAQGKEGRIVRTGLRSFENVAPGKDSASPLPALTTAQYEETQDALRAFDGKYNTFLNTYSQTKDKKHMNTLKLIQDIMGEAMAAPEFASRMQSEYALAVRGTPEEAKARIEQEMYRHIIQGKSWNGNTPEQMLEELHSSDVMNGNPSPYVFLAKVAEESDDVPEANRGKLGKIWDNFFRNNKPEEKKTVMGGRRSL